MTNDLLNVYDSDVQVLQSVLATLNERTYKRHELDAFDREIIERFAEAGFRVDVKWYDSTERGVFIPEVEVIGRCQPQGEFDHDRMRHEVVNNLLGLPEADAGIIKTDDKWTTAKAEEIHKHGPGCEH